MKILTVVLLIITGIYMFFGLFTCFAWNLGQDSLPLITSSLPPNNVFVYIVQIAFSLNLIFSYPLAIFPANNVIESYLYAGWPKSRKRQCFKNGNRALMIIFTCFVSLSVYNQLDLFLSVMGALTCTPIAFTIPAAFHYKACAETKCQKIIDLSLVIISLGILVFCTAEGVITWVNTPVA